MMNEKGNKMTNKELIEGLVKALQAEGRDPMFIVGYLESFLTQVVDGAPKAYKSQVHSDLVWHLNRRQGDAK